MTMDYDELFDVLSDADITTVRGQRTKELLSVQLIPSFDLYHTKSRSLINNSKQYKYLINEFVWYLNGDRNIKDIVEHSKFWKALADEKNCANSNYGYLTLYERCHNVNGKLLSPAEWCMHTLKKDINSRQAVMLYNKPQYVTDTNDFICTQTQQFICRGNTLHNIVNIRSSDAIRGLSFDIPWWRFIGNVIANSLGKVPGYMVVNIGSSHIYEPHFMLVNNMCCEDWVKYSLKTTLTLDKIYCHGKWNAADIEKALIIESYEDSDIRGDDSE